MSNINFGQFFNNFPDNVNRFVTGNTRNIGINTGHMNNEIEVFSNIQSNFPATTAQLVQTSAELAALNQSQTVDMLKDLLKMPKNFEQLLMQLTVNNQKGDVKSLLSLLNSKVILSEVSNLLQSNSKEALSNLYNMLARYNQLGVTLKEEQLNELTKLISFVSSSSASDVQTLKTVMLMYLPWLPLTEQSAFKLEIKDKNGSEASSEDDSVNILISTKNFGNLSAQIYKTQEDGIMINAAVSETFPVKSLNSAIKEDSKIYNVNISINFEVKKSFNNKKNEQTKIEVSVQAGAGVNPFLLLISNAFIKDVHVTDEKSALIEQRKEKLPDGKS